MGAAGVVDGRCAAAPPRRPTTIWPNGRSLMCSQARFLGIPFPVHMDFLHACLDPQLRQRQASAGAGRKSWLLQVEGKGKACLTSLMLPSPLMIMQVDAVHSSRSM